jgi:hypothetical protein
MDLHHFSEEAAINVFSPRATPAAPDPTPAVWAIDAEHAPSYWFPRDCPRACCWRNEKPLMPEGAALLKGAQRMHAMEAGWVERMRACRLYRYRLDAARFAPSLPEAGYWIAREDVRPLAVEPMGDLFARHAEAGIRLDIVPDLWPVIDAVLAAGLDFSIIRKANAQPRFRA